MTSGEIHALRLKRRNDDYSNPVVDQNYENDVGYNSL